MLLNKNGEPYYVIGSKKSYSTLKSKTKNELYERSSWYVSSVRLE